MSTTIGFVLEANIFVPTAQGRVQSGKHGFCRFVGMSDGRQKDPEGPSPDGSPSSENSALQFKQTQLATSVNGLTLERTVIPRDMLLSEWDIVGAAASSVKELHAPDRLGRKFFYLPVIDQSTGQNQTANLVTQPTDVSPASALITQQLGPLNNVNFTSHWSLAAGQGWALIDARFGVNSALQMQLADILNSVVGTTLGHVLYDDALAAELTRVSEFISVQWGLGSDLQWMLTIHSLRDERLRATLKKSTNGGQTWRTMDQQPTNTHQISGADFLRPSMNLACFYVESGTAVFEFGPGSPKWLFRDPEDSINGFVSPAGRVHVQYYGTSGYWLLNGLGIHKALPGGSVLGYALTAPLKLDPWVNPDNSASSLSFKFYPRGDDGSDISSTTDVATSASIVPDPLNSGQYHIRVDMTSRGTGGSVAPVVTGVSEIRQPLLEVISVSKGDIGPDTLEFEIEHNSHYRGGRARIKAKNETGQWSFLRRNELVKMDLSVITGTAGAGMFDPGTVSTSAAVRQFVGRVARRRFVQDAENFPNTPGTVELELEGWESRLAAKTMQGMPNFGGWGLAEAISYILARCGFYRANQGDYFGDLFDFRMDATRNTGIDPALAVRTTATQNGKGHRSFEYTDMDSPLQATDELLASQQLVWGEYPDGIIRAWTPNTYDPSATYTLDDSSFDPGTDCIRQVSVEQVLDNYRNTVLVHCKDKNGNDIPAQLYDYDAIYGSYDTTPNYVGDDLWDTHHGPDGADPWSIARTRRAIMVGLGTLISWETDLNLNLSPRNRVVVNLNNDATSHLGIAPGTPFLVAGKRIHGSLSGEDLTARTEFILGVPELTSGGQGA